MYNMQYFICNINYTPFKNMPTYVIIIESAIMIYHYLHKLVYLWAKLNLLNNNKKTIINIIINTKYECKLKTNIIYKYIRLYNISCILFNCI